MSDFEVKITGLDQVQKALESMPEKLRRGGIREALDAGAEVVRIAKMEAAPVSDRPDATPGFLKGHFSVRTSVKTDVVSGSARIGPSNAEYPRRGTKIRNAGRNKDHGLPPDIGDTRRVSDVSFVRHSKRASRQQSIASSLS